MQIYNFIADYKPINLCLIILRSASYIFHLSPFILRKPNALCSYLFYICIFLIHLMYAKYTKRIKFQCDISLVIIWISKKNLGWMLIPLPLNSPFEFCIKFTIYNIDYPRIVISNNSTTNHFANLFGLIHLLFTS